MFTSNLWGIYIYIGTPILILVNFNVRKYNFSFFIQTVSKIEDE